MKFFDKEGKMKFFNESGLEFIDISSEKFRTYVMYNGHYVTIVKPQWIYVTKTGHRVWDAEGVSHYIPNKWVHLFWEAKPDNPHFIF